LKKFQDRFSRLDTILACDIIPTSHLSTAKTVLMHCVRRVGKNELKCEHHTN